MKAAFNVFVFLPFFLFVLVPIVIVYQICTFAQKKFGKRLPRKQAQKQDQEVVLPAKDSEPQEQRKFDLVIYGATGFTGKLSCRYIAENYSNLKNFKWAIAGRSIDKLTTIKEELVQINPSLKDIEILVADSQNEQDLKKIVNDTRLILSLAGPYAKYGSILVKLCVQYGTHYADITGEVAWVRQMIIKYDNLAVQTGAKILSCCGNDCIPWELLAYKCFQQAKKNFPNEKVKKIAFVDFFNGGISGGTFTTLQFSLTNPMKSSSLGFDPLQKKIGEDTEVEVKHRSVFSQIGYNKKFKKFIGKFFNAPVNSAIIKRQNVLMGYTDALTYKEDMAYNNIVELINQVSFSMLLGAMIMCKPLWDVLYPRLLPQTGQGPTYEQMESGYCKLDATLTSAEGKKLSQGQFIIIKDPGYVETAKMICETGLALILNKDDIKTKGGFHTPVTALNDVLLKRLTEKQMFLQVE